MNKFWLLWRNYQQYLPPAIILLVALILRLPLLNGSFWLDEAAQALESARPLSAQLDIIPDFQPPLLHLITHFALYVSSAEWWLRTIGALIPGLITVWATFELGKKLAGGFAGSIAALLLATNSFHIFYSQELRPYSLATMFALLGWLILANWKKYRPKNRVLGLSVVTALGLYSSYLYPFVVFSQALYCFIFKKKFHQQFVTAFSFGALAFLPWLPTFLRQLEAGQYLRQVIPGWETVVSLSQLKALPLTLGKFLYGIINIDFTPAYIIPTLMISSLLAMLLASDYLTNRTKTRKYFKIMTVWILFPLLTAWTISFVVPVISPKRILFLLPLMYLYIAIVVGPYLQDKATSLRGGLAVLVIIILALINMGGVMQYYSQPSLQRENWRQLYRQMSIQYPADTSVAVYSFPEPFAPMRWYDTQNYPAITTGELHVDRVKNLPGQLKNITNYRYVLVFDYLMDLTDPQRKVLAVIRDFGYHEVDQLDYPNIGFVRVFTQSETVTAQLSN